MIKLGKIVLLLVVCATTMGGFLWIRPVDGFLSPPLARIVVFHVPCSMVGYLASAVATWYAIVYLLKRKPLDDIKSRVSFALGLLFWVLTTVTGAIFSNVQWGAYWSWDIKQGCILMLLLILVGYFALRAAVDDPRKRAALGAAYAVFAMLAVPFLTYVLPNSTPDTMHPKGVVTTKEGLDHEYKVILWTGVLALSLVYVWAFRLHVALESIQLRLDLRNRLIPAGEN